MKRPKSDYAIQTVTNALRLLEAFGGEQERGVTELSRRLDLHKNNVFRLLATLEGRGYVEQAAGSERYRLGVRCLELSHSFMRSSSLVARARPALLELVRATGETAHLGVLRDFEVFHLDGRDTPHLLRPAVRSGERLPAHCTALGKVLLGCGDPLLLEEYDSVVVQPGLLESRTAATIVDRDKLFEHLRMVGGQGFALDLGECADGLHCAAVPLYDRGGQPLAALSVSAPATRADVDHLLRAIVPALFEQAASVSRQLGFDAA